MIKLLNILRVAQIVACGVVIAWVAVHMAPKKEEKGYPCDKCKNLKIKRKKSNRHWGYECSCRAQGFDDPPEYCYRFEERETSPKKEEPPKEEKPKKEEPTKRTDNKMRTLEQIDRDIAFVKFDIEQLKKMHSPISVAAEDLLELYDERQKVVEAMEAMDAAESEKMKGETVL